MILITGASSGIGKATAVAFAKLGRSLLLVARRKERLEELKEQITRTFRVNVVIHPMDVRSKEDVAVFQKSQDHLLKQVTVLVNNAGLARGANLIQEAQLEHWEQMIDTNLKGLLYMTRIMLPYFIDSKQGHIINIGSVASRWIYPRGNVYCATKRAVSALTESMRLDLNGLGIRITEISPGMVETEFSLVRLEDPEKAQQVYQGLTPLRPEDIAETIVWCALRPSHVNVQELVIYPTDQASTMLVHRKT